MSLNREFWDTTPAAKLNILLAVNRNMENTEAKLIENIFTSTR
jgi:hypothetical protein